MKLITFILISLVFASAPGAWAFNYIKGGDDWPDACALKQDT